MWVSRKQWETVHDRLDLRREETDRLRDCVTILERRLAAIEERVSKVEKQVIQPGIVGVSGMLDAYLFGPRPAPTTLYQKVSLLLDHLKLRVQPEGTTPAALVETGAK